MDPVKSRNAIGVQFPYLSDDWDYLSLISTDAASCAIASTRFVSLFDQFTLPVPLEWV